MRDNKINYILVGIFVIGMVVALLVSIATLTGRTGDTESYYAVYSNVSGVARGTKVLYEGFAVGQVDRVEPVRAPGDTRFKVWMDIQSGWSVPKDSVARIAASGLLSAVMVDIKGGTSSDMVKPQGEIPAASGGNLFAVMTDVANEVSDLSQSTLRPLLQNLNGQVDVLGVLLRERAPELLANLISVSEDLKVKTPAITQNMQEFSTELTETGNRLNKVLRDENIGAIDKSLDNVEKATANVAVLAGDMHETRKRLDQILASLDNVVAGNRDSVQGSLNDLRQTMSTISRSVNTISQDLEGAARNMNEFTRDVRRNPGTLLRSGSPPEDRPGRR